MNDKITVYVISFILCIVLFISEIFLLIQYNTVKGIRKQDLINIIDNINIEDEIKKLDNYQKLEQKLHPEVLNEIINSTELNTYIKENIKSIYLKIIYGENLEYTNNIELKKYINDRINELQEISEPDKIEILNIFDQIIEEIENTVEETSNMSNINIIEKFMTNKTTTYILIITIIISLGILLINKSKTGLIFIGLPTIITGVIFIILELILTQKINITGIDRRVLYAANTYLPNLAKTLKKSSMIMTTIGFIECALYTVLNYQEKGNEDGKI